MSAPVLATVQRTVASRFPRMSGKRVLAAASGGADSTALVLALRELGCEVVLAHVHHGIRGKTADADARFVRRFARKLDVPFVEGRFDVPAEARRSGESLEMAARRVRRAFLIETARRENLRWVAVGQTADDQAETVLMRIVRGTSVAGLAGIPYRVAYGRVTFVRPLRDVTRADVLAFLKDRRQGWREDESNADDFARRNRVRHEILPMLERRLNPGVRQALLRLAEIAAAEDDVMVALTEHVRREGATGRIPAAIRRRLAQMALRRQSLSPDRLDFAAIERFSMAWKTGKNVFHGMENPENRRLRSEGKNPDFPRCGKKFSMAWKTGEKIFHGVENPETAPGLEIRAGRGFSRRADEVCLSAAAVGGRDLVLRSWRPGDRMEPLGMKGSKKLSDIFTDAKVPRGERNRRVVVECGGEIAALAGWRVSRGFAVEHARAASIRIRILTP